MKINEFLDATYLKTAEQAEISEEKNLQNVLLLTKEAIKYNYKLLMIRAKYISIIQEVLQKANASTLIGTVIGFPEGTNAIEEKLQEAKHAIFLGVDELDFVINYKAFKKGNFSLVDKEILICTKICLEYHKTVKWIIETAALSNEEIIVISQRIKEVVLENFTLEQAENVYVKSSTGFYKTTDNLPNGATLENMKLIIANAKPLKVKAAGGVKDYEVATKMIALGVDRIGTSSAKEIVNKDNTLTKSNLY